MGWLNRFEGLKDQVESAIKPFIKVKIYLRKEYEKERVEGLLKDEYYLERLERLTHLFLEKKVRSVLIVPLSLPAEEVRKLEEDEEFLSSVERLAEGFRGDTAD